MTTVDDELMILLASAEGVLVLAKASGPVTVEIAWTAPTAAAERRTERLVGSFDFS